jgi:hypothetical protein
MKVKQSQYYVAFDSAGNIAGFYVDTIHGDAIPETAIPITQEQWETYSAAPHLYKLDGDMIREKTTEEIEDELAQQPPLPPSMEQRLNAVEDMLLGILLGGV